MSLNDYFTNALVRTAYSLHARRDPVNHLELLDKLDRSQYYDRDTLKQIQVTKLRKLLKTAFESSPFWKKRFMRAGFKSTDFDRIESPEDIEPLSKKDVLENRDRIVNQDYPPDDLIENRTGGTTGSALYFYIDPYREAMIKAATLRHDLWTGFRQGDLLAILWGAPDDIDRRKPVKTRMRELFWGKNIFLDSNRLTDDIIAGFIDRWRAEKPQVFLGYSGALGFLARYLEGNGVKLPSPKTVIASAEMLTEADREVIERVFRAPVFERYGCREMAVIASECEYHDGLHINVENLYLEYDPLETLPDGRVRARLMITDLENLVFPFIRYQIGDIVIINPDQKRCRCGRNLPTISEVGGRVSDYIKLPGGRFVSGTGLTVSIMSKYKQIRKTQIVQKSIDHVIIRIVKNEDFDENTLKKLNVQFARAIGDDVRLEFEFPDDIPREKSGKYRLTISEVMD